MKEPSPSSVIISGYSLRFPESQDVNSFAANLYDGVDMVTEDSRRWPVNMYGLPGRSGKIPDISSFDADFFGIPREEANLMDHQTRMLLETTFEAILDAGLVPDQIKGKRTGVFFASFFNEMDGGISIQDEAFIPYRQHLSRHLNYVFDFKGPSKSYDTACSSSFSALNEAVLYLKTGQLDYALVVGANVAIWPSRCLQFEKMSFLSKEGKCAYLDESGKGYVKCEAVSAFILQRNDCIPKPLRNYCEVVGVKTNADGFKEEGVTFPSGRVQKKLLQQVYEEAGVDPLEMTYIEAHGTGTQAGDTQETQAIYEFFCQSDNPNKKRKNGLLVGSVKTNMGHGEAVSGFASMIKVILAFENESLPPILHLKNINPKLTPVMNGDLIPVTKTTLFKGNLIGISSFGFGGANGHVILKKNSQDEEVNSNYIVNRYDRLVLCSGRTEEAVNVILNEIERKWNNKSSSNNKDKLSNSFLRILNNVSKLTPSQGMNWRGSIILPSNNSLNPRKEVKMTPFPCQEGNISHFNPEKKPKVLFLYSGLGCQSKGMIRELIKIDCFNAVLEEASKILDPLLKQHRNTTLHDLLYSQDDKVEE